MNIWKRLLNIIYVAIICITTCLTGCGNITDADSKDSLEAEDKIRIGVAFDSYVIERWQMDKDVFVSTASGQGAEVNVQSATGDVEEQKRIIDYFIEQGEDVIVIVPVDCNSLSESIEQAKRAGIKIISYDRIIRNANVDLYISFDNEKVGTLMAETINSALPDGGNCIKVNGPSEDYNVSLINKGFDRILNKNINIIDETECSGWVGEEASNYLNAHSDELDYTDAIMCGNDSLADQVVTVLSERRKAGDITVVAQDADLEACQRIVEGTQAMTVYKPIETLAKTAAFDAIALAKGEKLANTAYFNDGTYDVKYVSIEPSMVNKSNIDKIIIDSGFHLREDVYQNVDSSKK